MCKIWTFYYSPLFQKWAIFNTKYKTISHYEDTKTEAILTCHAWNKEKREF